MPRRTEPGLAANNDELQRLVLINSARGDGANPKTFARALTTAVRTKVWLRLEGPGGRPFGSLREFMTAPREDGGVGLTEDQVVHAARLAGPDTADLVRQQGFADLPEAQPRGRPENYKALIIKSSLGPTAENIVRRLKRDDPELAERVVQGELTPNAAALAKGWLKPRIVITSPEAVARSLRRHMAHDDLARLAELLQEEG